MAKTVYWCPNCQVPIIENEICPVCSTKCKPISLNGICNPVFFQEKRLLSCILGKNVNRSEIWYLGSSYYLIDGKRIRLKYIDFSKQKKHFEFAGELRNEISNDIEAEEYVVTLVEELKKTSATNYIPTVSFSGGKDSTVVSRVVRDALQNESIIHYFGDTTLEFPATYDYVIETFRNENPFTPMIPSETENDFFKLCKVFGPPSKFERWCCTIFKTSNLNTEYQTLNGNSLTFLGIRHSESKERQKYERTQNHSKNKHKIFIH